MSNAPLTPDHTGVPAAGWRLREAMRADRSSWELAALGVLIPLLLVSQPLQPVRALAAMLLLLVLPGLAVVRLLELRDTALVLTTVPAASMAATVVTATGLMYAHCWSWQLTVCLLGAGTAIAAIATPRTAEVTP